MDIVYFKAGSGFIAVTHESPKGFRGVLYVGRGGPTLDQITEQVWTVPQLSALTKVPKSAMPDEWLLALGYEKPAPKPRPSPRPEPTYEIVEEPVFDLEGTELLDLAPVRRPIYQPAGSLKQAQRAQAVGYAIAFGIFLLWVIFA